jgi:very-short-patch-repair endonuclease
VEKLEATKEIRCQKEERDMKSEKRHRIAPEIRNRSKQLRKSLTPAEQKLWKNLRNRNLGNYKFRRQHPIGPFIVDFYCAAVKLVIEIDGSSHIYQEEYDQTRTIWLEDQGYHVIRFRNDAVLQEVDSVTEEIVSVCNHLKVEKG